MNIASVAVQASGPGITVAGTSPASSAGDSLFIGLQLREQNKTTDAKDFFINFLREHPDDQAAYVYLCSCADSTTLPEIIGYFQSLPAQAAKENQLLLGSLYQREGRYDLAEQLNDSIISDNPNTPLKVKAEMNNLFIDIFDKSDLQGAEVLLSNIESDSNLTTPIELRNAEMAVALHGQPSVLPAAGSQKVTSISASNLPKTYGISQNYPNPFNPTTVINYQLPMSSHVTLRVYDILGRVVASLVDVEEPAGYHNVTFDGSRLHSTRR